ncbi:molybdopterin-guanine dinucleotide biosynthesis protein B [Thiohalocapsa marina]|uniref:molybdopterin-guanine dinucleotide biosynthesis protein B n=1 Tax=Thiohalocapsa marina TaxID=424902 RepID=UPI0036D93E41|nr:molybdopterin-guanine dinucleotide biosynthesis protein B [Sphingobacteriia bacterium]NCC41374.1 molybdopterin-guanine dinucleotide biosynthesis protein B [Gammaproteobacteria bacterium]
MSERSIPVVGFVAPSCTGKTTLVRQLVPELSARGLRVGYLKHAHHRFDLDTPGKDSFVVREAGARQTLLASQARWALQVENPVQGEDPDLDRMLSRFELDRLDLVIVEGFKHADFPKIEVHRPALGQPPLYPADPGIIAVATDEPPPIHPHPPLLPLNEPATLADFILSNRERFIRRIPD